MGMLDVRAERVFGICLAVDDVPRPGALAKVRGTGKT